LKVHKLLSLILPLSLLGCFGASDNTNNPPPAELLPPQSEILQDIMDLPLSVVQMFTDGDAQIAATSEGLYWRDGTNAVWMRRSPTTTEVTGVAVVDAGYYIVSVTRQDIDNTDVSPLYVTFDSGENWELIQHDFGREFNDPILKLAYDSANEKIYATSTVALAVSDKNAMEWTLLSGFWDGFASGLSMLKIDTVNQQIWFGGQGVIENGTLSRFSPNTETTENWQGLLPDPSSYKGGIIHPVDLSTFLFSGEGGIVLSTDNGVTWSTPLGDVDSTFYFDIVIDQSMILYTAQWQKDGSEQPLIIECSSDSGVKWSTNNFSQELTLGGTISMMVVEDNTSTLLYLGLEDNGIKAVDVSNLDCG
jgi:hypothetical protein